MNYIKIEDELPLLNGLALSARLIVRCQEFGCAPCYAVARAWKSSLPDQPIKFYLDSDFYHIDASREIAELVTHWAPFPFLEN